MSNPSILRLTQTSSQNNAHTIELELLDASARQTATATVAVAVSEQDQQDIRWYMEEYAKEPFEPHPARAARIEERMRELGHELFTGLFEANPRTTRLWARVMDQLDDLRVEVVTDAEGATALPWELLCDPQTDTTLALHARSFVRAAPEVPRRALALEQEHVVRILLVICRPGGRNDVPFRSVASRLLKGLSNEARQVFQLDVLRPPTFARLGQVLREAKAKGQPYHVVHFDGHGVYGPPARLRQSMTISPMTFASDGPQGFLLFETDDPDDRRELIHGSKLGDLLVQNDVPLLVLNACRSAHAEQPQTDAPAEPPAPAAPPQDDDPYEKVRAFGSLAQQVMLAGVGGVVAMRYNVYVVTAAQFVAELYRALVQGRSLGEAVSRGRKNLYEQPVREVVQKLELQDWLVPVVYEAQAMQVFTPPSDDLGLTFSITSAEATPTRGTIDKQLPPEPDAGFFGRDETLLALDRSFDTQQIVLLHAFAGSGKTTAAAEFARWYALTGGVNGPVLYSSFEQRMLLAQLLDQLGLLFNPMLRQSGIDWQALTDLAQKRDLALQILRQVPVLWLWDNVEPVTGFPAGTPSAWTDAEQRELRDFLRDARSTKAKFLLTSRRDERRWLGDLPARVELPPMPMYERQQLAEALAAKYGVTLDQAAWRPLLRYSEGNPMTLTVVMSQTLRDRLRSAQQIAAYVQRLRAGEAVFDDDTSEGRSRSLGASLDYGFATAFTEQERAIVALLHHFQGFVDVDALSIMGDTRRDWHIPDVANLTREQAITLLDRAAEVGLLTAFGGGYYRIHPALPWFFRRLYQEYHTQAESFSTTLPTTDHLPQAPDPARAYVEAMSDLSNYYWQQYEDGNCDSITMLTVEEANLLHARRLAQQHGWYGRIISTMQGLSQLYDHTGRRTEWRQLVEEVLPFFVDPANDGPVAEREGQYNIAMSYRVRLLQEEREWNEAARLQELLTDYNRQQAVPLLGLSQEKLNSKQRNILHLLSTSLHELGQIQREQGDPRCLTAYEEDYQLSLKLGDEFGAAVTAFNLGQVYDGSVPVLRDLTQAEHWYRRSLELRSEQDRLGRGRVQGQLGYVAYEGFMEARHAQQPDEVLLKHLNAALQAYQNALKMIPPDEVSTRATIHNQLGLIWTDADEIDQAIAHFRNSILYMEQAGDLFGAARTRKNVALAYANAGRFDDALLFARAALRNFEQFGPAADRVARVQELIAEIEEMARGEKQ